VGRYGSPEERFWPRVEKTDSCWIWTGAKKTGHSTGPYGHFEINGKSVLAHRYAYEALVGPIPSGLTIDHLCRNPLCVNPSHLEPVTRKENILRGVGATAMHARKTHCKNGHEFNEANTYIRRDGNRLCRVCRNIRMGNYRNGTGRVPMSHGSSDDIAPTSHCDPMAPAILSTCPGDIDNSYAGSPWIG